MPHPSLSKPLSSDECIEMDELLAQLDESSYAMDASQADGFLTALCLLPQEVSPTEWMPKIFCAPEATPSRLPDTQQNKLEELIYRRYKEINNRLAHFKPLDPIVFDPEDEFGNPLSGEEEIVALEPFASGFLTAAQTWSGLLDSDNDSVIAALIGIWRHLPEEEIGDFSATRDELLSDSPLENLDDAIEDIALCVKQIATATRGFKEPAKAKIPVGRKRHPKKRSV